MGRFSNKVVLITGSSAGIGEATALYFAKEGASLVLNGRNIEKLNNLSNTCKSLSKIEEPLVFACDVTEPNFAKDIIEATIKRFGKLDILINNAGILHKYESLQNMDFDAYAQIMNTNLTSVLKLMKEAIPHLEKTKGNVVNVSSFAGHRAIPTVLAYSISKAGLDQLTKCSSLELASKGIRVNSVNPGVIITDIQKKAGLTDESYAKYLEHNKSVHPLGRVGHVNEVATVIAFLASDDASFMTGALLPIDGGKHAFHPR